MLSHISDIKIEDASPTNVFKVGDLLTMLRGLELQLPELSIKIENLERKYQEDDLPKDLFKEFHSEYIEKRKETINILTTGLNLLSNPEKEIRNALNTCDNLSKMWHSTNLSKSLTFKLSCFRMDCTMTEKLMIIELLKGACQLN